MQITITLDTADLSNEQQAALGTLVHGGAVNGASTPAPAAKKTAAAPKPTKAAEAEPENDEGADEPESGSDGEVTREEATKVATDLVSSGQAAKVKAALGKVGAKRVSEIADDKLAEFVAELS